MNMYIYIYIEGKAKTFKGKECSLFMMYDISECVILLSPAHIYT